jgi:hypothetical protein
LPTVVCDGEDAAAFSERGDETLAMARCVDWSNEFSTIR